jgi:hypothetical protein
MFLFIPEWYPGKNAIGHVNPGAIIKLNSKLTLAVTWVQIPWGTPTIQKAYEKQVPPPTV